MTTSTASIANDCDCAKPLRSGERAGGATRGAGSDGAARAKLELVWVAMKSPWAGAEASGTIGASLVAA